MSGITASGKWKRTWQRTERLWRRIETKLAAALAAHAALGTRIALGAIFLWFGALKFFPGCCAVDAMAQQTLQILTLHRISPGSLLLGLALAECAIGLGLATGLFRRATLTVLVLHLCGTFLPLLLLRGETWNYFPFAPTLAGQYILKNVVLLGAAAMLGAKAFARSSAAQKGLQLVPARAA